MDKEICPMRYDDNYKETEKSINFCLSFYLSKMLIKQVMNFSQQQKWCFNPPLGEVFSDLMAV